MVRCAIDKAHQIHFRGLHMNVFSTSVQLAIKKKKNLGIEDLFLLPENVFCIGKW